MGKRKRRSKKIAPTLLECLPNETLITVFSYLNGVDAVFAFSNLNHRFQCLLFEYCQLFDFKSISKAKFDFIFQQHNTKQWKSLQIFNDDHTPGQIEYFIQNYSLIEHFPQLQSLSILEKKDKCRYYLLLHQLRFLTNLNSLTMESMCGTKMSQFNLPKLKQLVVSSCRNTKWILNLSQLESLEYTLTNSCRCDADFTWPSTLKRLKITFVKDEDIVSLPQSFTHLSRLITLEIYQKERGRSLPNGQLWEQLIRSSFPLLKNFRFYFQFEYSLNPSDQIKEIVASFSSVFYVHEKNWFIHCDISYKHRCRAILYSLPFAFDQFTTYRSYFGKIISNLPEDYVNNTDIYANVKTLDIDNKYAEPEENFKKAEIINLIINVEFICANWLRVLPKLRHISFGHDAIMSPESFHIILANAPHLYSLAVEKNMLQTLTNNWTNSPVCSHLSYKIRYLKFYPNDNLSQCLNENDLHHIVQIFAGKCQHLSLSIQSQTAIIGSILRCMEQLRSLHVHIMEMGYPPIIMEWFDKQHTNFNHSNCIITRKEQNYYFWLGKHL